MSPRSNVRGHTRARPGGGTTRVRPHTRGLVSPRHSWSLMRRAFAAGRRRRKVTAFVLGGLAVAELGAWLTVSGVALIAATAAVLFGATAVVAAQAGGMPAPGMGGGRRRASQRGTSPKSRPRFGGDDT